LTVVKLKTERPGIKAIKSPFLNLNINFAIRLLLFMDRS